MKKFKFEDLELEAQLNACAQLQEVFFKGWDGDDFDNADIAKKITERNYLFDDQGNPK